MRIIISRITLAFLMSLLTLASGCDFFAWSEGAIKTPPSSPQVWYNLTASYIVEDMPGAPAGDSNAWHSYSFTGQVCELSSEDQQSAIEGAAGGAVPVWIEQRYQNVMLQSIISGQITSERCDDVPAGTVQGASLQQSG